MSRVFFGIANYYNSNRYSFHLTARHGRNGKTITITSARDPIKITVHKRRHTLQQFNTWRIVAVGGVLFK